MNHKLLLCSDMDRTLIPNGAQPESKAARQTFRDFVNHDKVLLVYVTGRDESLIKEAMAYYKLPQPDYVIADVGMSIYKAHSDTDWEFWHEWQDCYKHDWQGQTNKDLALLFENINVLRKQEIIKQKIYKLSYYIPLYVNHQDLIHQMQTTLQKQGINAELIWSVDEPSGIGLLDVMPKSATKRTAIEFLMKTLSFNLNNTLFAGDSGNDLDVILSPIKSILVANTHQDIKELVKPYLQPYSDNVYLAQGGFKNMNGNYSSGVMEGVYHYIPNIEEILGGGQ